MRYKRITMLLVCLVFSVLSVGILYFLSAEAKESKNNFIRILPSHQVNPGNIIDLKQGRWYLAGINRDSIYIGNIYTPDKLIRVDLNVKDTVGQRLKFPEGSKLTKAYFNSVGDNTIYTLDGNQSAAFLGNLNVLSLRPAAKPPYFTLAAYLRKQSFILRVVQNGENRLVRYRTDSAGFKTSANLLSKQIDGIFSTDGNLIAEPKSGKIFYVYYYRNQFICADSNLNLGYQGKTIDTNTVAKLKVANIKSQNQTTLAAPPIEVNKRVAVNEKYLFIQSGLAADNEVQESLENVSTIDIYAVKDGKYQFSFYLPDFSKKKLTDFKVYGNNLYALFDHYLYHYKLNF